MVRHRAFRLVTWLVSVALAAPASAATFVVDSVVDAVDEVPGNGICRTAAGACTLRAAVQESNALPGADAIDVPAGVYVLALSSGSGGGSLDVRDDLTITGAGA